MKLKKITGDGAEYYVIADDEEQNESLGKSQNLNTDAPFAYLKDASARVLGKTGEAIRAAYHRSVGAAKEGASFLGHRAASFAHSIAAIPSELERRRKEKADFDALVALLPYADRALSARIAKRLKEMPDLLCSADLKSLLPQLHEEDRDGIFLFFIESAKHKPDVSALLPLVSAGAVTRASELYAEGRLSKLDLDLLSESDVALIAKRLLDSEDGNVSP